MYDKNYIYIYIYIYRIEQSDFNSKEYIACGNFFSVQI